MLEASMVTILYKVSGIAGVLAASVGFLVNCWYKCHPHKYERDMNSPKWSLLATSGLLNLVAIGLCFLSAVVFILRL